jgi:hypothetical protein
MILFYRICLISIWFWTLYYWMEILTINLNWLGNLLFCLVIILFCFLPRLIGKTIFEFKQIRYFKKHPFIAMDYRTCLKHIEKIEEKMYNSI